MSRQPTQTYRQVWLVVAEGGWWKASEIAGAMPDDERGNDVHVVLWQMTKTGYLVRRTIPVDARAERQGRSKPESVEYAVTPECLIPMGMTAQCAMQALTGRAVQ